jgi:hypothetical protein
MNTINEKTHKEKLIEAVKYFENKITKQGIVINDRDAQHLTNLKSQLNQLKQY